MGLVLFDQMRHRLSKAAGAEAGGVYHGVVLSTALNALP